MKSGLFTAPIIFSFLIANAAAPEIKPNYKSCAPVLTKPENIAKLTTSEFGKLKKDFRLDTTYTKELARIPVKNQCNWGSCWAMTLTGAIETTLAQQHGAKVKLHPQYLVAMHIVTNAVAKISKYGSFYMQGDSQRDAINLIQKYGLVTAAAWKPKVDISNIKVSSRFNFYISHIVEQYQTAYKELENERAILEAKEAGSLTGVETEKLTDIIQAQQALMESAEAELMKLVTSVMGELPKTFKFEGEEVTPVQFANEILALGDVGLYRMKFKRTPVKQVTETTQAPKVLPAPSTTKEFTVMGDAEEVSNLIMNEIDNERPVVLALDWEKAFVDPKTGTMSIGAFHSPFQNFKINADYFAAFNQGGHAVLVVGYKLGPDGKVIQFKILNSWGDEVGDGGYYHLHRDYFDVFGIATSSILPKSLLERIEASQATK